MRTRVLVFTALLCVALPLYSGEDQSDSSSSVVTMTIDADNPEVVSSFSWGIAAASRADAGGTVFKELTITKLVDKSSPKLFQHCASGEHYKKVTIEVRKAKNKQDFLIITMTDVQVSSYQVGGTDMPTETISLTYAKVDYLLSGQ